jgi:hypothetical protein
VVQNYMNHRRSADSIFKRYDYCHWYPVKKMADLPTSWNWAQRNKT